MRVQRYVRTKENDKRLQEIKNRAKENPKCLQILIFDEAHHGATSQHQKDKRETPYSFLSSEFNSDDYPNVIVLLVSATPWNLMTVLTKLEKEVVICSPQGDNGIGKLESKEGTLSSLKTKQEIQLHEIAWNHGQEGDLLNGKKVKIMVLMEKHKYFFLRADFENGCVSTFPSDVLDESLQTATTFTVKGSIYGSVQISCKNDAGEELYWTWPESKAVNLKYGRNDTAKIMLKAKNDSNKEFQNYSLNMEFGNDLASFSPYHQRYHGRFTVYVHQHTDENKGYLRINKAGRLGGTKEFCPKAPNKQSFLLFPKNTKTKFYLSLNHMVNSLRYNEVSDQRIRHDTRFTRFLTYQDKDKVLTPSSLICSDYSLALLLVKPFHEIEKHIQIMKDSHDEEDKEVIYSYMTEGRDNIEEFIRDLDPSAKHNESHKPVNPEAFEHYLRILQSEVGLEPCYVILYTILQSVLDKRPFDLRDEEYKTICDQAENLEEKLWKPLGASGQIIRTCLNNFDEPNGRMAIVRASNGRIENGNEFKQSLCIAKKVANINIEIVQDYGEQTTLTLHMHAKNSVKDAERFDHPESLRIMKKIQCDDCEKVDGKGNQACNCSSYCPQNDKTLVCKNCKHIHKELKSYADLDGLPCLLILVNKGRLGDTFPHSLVAMDDRTAHKSHKNDQDSTVNLTTFAQEKGRLCRYTTFESALPFVYVSQGLYKQLRKSLECDCAYWNSFKFTGRIDCLVKFNSDKNQLEPEKRSADAKNKGDKRRKRNHFLLSAEPQCGKTGVYLLLIAALRKAIERSEYKDLQVELDVEDVSEDDVESESARSLQDYSPIDQFQAIVPNWKHLQKLDPVPKTAALSKYSRFTGEYHYPVESAPNMPRRKQRPHQPNIAKETLNHDLVAHRLSHSCISCSFDALAGAYFQHISIDSDWFSGTITITYPDLEQYNNFVTEQKRSNIVTILTPSFNRIHTARLNWNHLMKRNDGSIEPFLHFVFVRKEEAYDYISKWGNYVAIVEVPKKMEDIEEDVYEGGVGYVRRFIQRFADLQNIDSFYMCDDSIVYFRRGKTLNGIVQRNDNGIIEMENVSFLDLHMEVNKIGSNSFQVPEIHREYERHPDCENGSIQIDSYSGPFNEFGIIGARKYRPKLGQRNMFSKTHCTSFMKINNKALIKKGLLFKPWKALEDLHFCNDVDQAGFNVVKLSYFEFIKAHSRDPLDLYIWNANEVVGNNLQPSSDIQERKIQVIMTHFARTVKVAETFNYIEDDPFVSLFIEETEDDDDGTCLIFVEDIKFRDFPFPSSYNDLTIIFPLTEYYNSWTFGDFHKIIREEAKRGIDEFVIGSTHKPREVDKDYVILQIRLKPTKLKKIRPVSECNDENLEPRTAEPIRATSDPDLLADVSTNQRKRSANRAQTHPGETIRKRFRKPLQPLERVEEQSIKLEDSETVTDPQEPENSLLGDDRNYNKSYYAINSIMLKGVRENLSEGLDIVVHVTTEVEKSSESPKYYVLVEDIGPTQGYHSCMMFWYDESQPEGLQDLKPRSICRIENVVAKLHEDEEYHQFQLKLTRNSRILSLPYQELPFCPKPISTVFDGLNELFIDAKGTLINAFTQKREDWSSYLCLEFKDCFCDERFEVRSELPTNFKPKQPKSLYLTGYENQVLRIRSAKVLQRATANSQTVLYKNYHSICHFNS